MADLIVGYDDVLEVLVNLRVAVRETRRRERLSVRDVADRSGVPAMSISRFERGDADLYLANAVLLVRWLAQSRKDDYYGEGAAEP